MGHLQREMEHATKTHLVLGCEVGEAALELGRLHAVAAAAEQVVVVLARGECCAVAGRRELVSIIAEDSPLTG